MRPPVPHSWRNVSRSVVSCCRIIATVLVSVFPALLAFAADQHTDTLATYSPQLVSLTINGKAESAATLVLRDSQGGWLIPSDILSAAKIRLPPQSSMMVEEEKTYAPLSLLNVSALSFDQRNQSLDIRFDASAFNNTQITLQSAYQLGIPQEPAGMFINYDLQLTSGSSTRSESLFTEFGIALGKGVGLLNIASVSNENSHRLIRLETSYTLNTPSDMTALRLGDSITRPATTLGRPVRFGGIQYSTDFQLRPGLVTVPVPTISGQAALPSTAELYVNNVLQTSTSLQPGPFSITTAPIVSGDGDVLIRVRDIAGREELISSRFYSSPSLLAPGLSAFSIEAGALRSDYALPEDRYEKPFVASAYRRGISDNLTLEGGGSLASSGPAGVLGSATVVIPAWGVASLAAGWSQDHDGSGKQIAASFERRTTQASLALRAERSDEGYRQLGINPVLRIRNLDMAFFSYRFDGLGTLGLSFTRQQRASSDAVEIFGASFSTPASRIGSFIINALQSRSEEKNYSISVFWIMPLGGGMNSSLSHTRNQQNQDTTVLQVQKNVPFGEGIGWRLQTAINSAQQAAVFLQKPYGTFSAEAASLHGGENVRVGMSGAVVRMNEHWFPTRRISGSYGLVSLPGIQNARIYVDNQFSTRTDSEGYALLPRLRPYVLNHVSVEQLDLPLDSRIDQLTVRPVPAWRSGVMVNFAIKKASAATLRIVDVKGNEIPAGAILKLQGSAEIFAVGREGVAYVEGISKENFLELQWSGQHCTVYVPYSPAEDIVPYLGEFICR